MNIFFNAVEDGIHLEVASLNEVLWNSLQNSKVVIFFDCAPWSSFSSLLNIGFVTIGFKSWEAANRTNKFVEFLEPDIFSILNRRIDVDDLILEF